MGQMASDRELHEKNLLEERMSGREMDDVDDDRVERSDSRVNRTNVMYKKRRKGWLILVFSSSVLQLPDT